MFISLLPLPQINTMRGDEGALLSAVSQEHEMVECLREKLADMGSGMLALTDLMERNHSLMGHITEEHGVQVSTAVGCGLRQVELACLAAAPC
jgi:hypothetical protein